MRDGVYYEEEGMVKFYLRGRPIITYAPTDVMETYTLSKMNMAPSSKLKIEWVYPFFCWRKKRMRYCLLDVFQSIEILLKHG